MRTEIRPAAARWPAVAFTFLLVLVPLAAQQQDHKAHDSHDERALKENPAHASSQIAPLLAGLGTHHHPVTTKSPRAQLFFDQGLKLAYGFNHQEALRAFKEAARLDPDCAMAYWGWALALAPNLNLPMQESVAAQAFEAAQLALSKINKVSEQEAGYIRAVAKLFTKEHTPDRAALDLAYADAMRELHSRYPDDLDAATLYAAALMNLSPWDYWTKDGRPKERTPVILTTLEKVLEKDPDHEGALHYYIHAVEAADPKSGEQTADRLRGLAPGAGHLVHMPSHIYIQTGRYRDALEVNILASQADEGYITQCRAQGIYPLAYYPHNVHFLAWAAMMLGDSRTALEASRKVAANVPKDHKEDAWAIYQTFLSMPLYSLVRFGQWDEILAEPVPPDTLRFHKGIAHYARGLAFLRKGEPQSFAGEEAGLRKILTDPETAKNLVGFSNAEAILSLALAILEGEQAAKARDYTKAISLLEKAVRMQDGLMYTEPPAWYYPVRHSLGAVLLEAGLPKEAEVIYWQDLKQFPENGFSLYGVWQSLKAQGRDAEADAIHRRFQTAWAYADTDLPASRW